ncbi:MAG: hypothetical protein U9R27_10520 [Campylobacterota bacterium]|nr:hypothetical protein [Campylobacterota bacterium]
MNENLINKYITIERLSTYKNIEDYKQNLQKSKHLYIPLSILEVTLRNSINNLYERFYGRGWLINEANFLHQKELEKIHHAKSKLRDKNDTLIKDKLIAELTFGFWTGLFKTLYDNKMRFNNLKQIFPNLPSRDIQKIDRKNLSKKLNHIREFRNRVFHHENINKELYATIEDDIYEILDFFDSEIANFVRELNKEE